MPQPQISKDVASSIVSLDLSAATLKCFVDFISKYYEPNITTIIEKMCGIFKNQDIKTVSSLLMSHRIISYDRTSNNDSGIHPRRFGINREQTNVEQILNARRVPPPWNNRSSRRRVKNYIVDPDLSLKIEKHTYISLRKFQQVSQWINYLICVCENWGLNDVEWAKNVETDETCIVIIWNARHIRAPPHNKDIIEILLPKTPCCKNIINAGGYMETQNNYVKMYHGYFVGYISKDYVNTEDSFTPFKYTPLKPSDNLLEYQNHLNIYSNLSSYYNYYLYNII